MSQKVRRIHFKEKKLYKYYVNDIYKYKRLNSKLLLSAQEWCLIQCTT
jgi:hypothetical protein